VCLHFLFSVCIVSHLGTNICRENYCSKIGATICQILRLICTKFDFRSRGYISVLIGGDYRTPPDYLAVLRGLFLRGGGRER